MLVSMDIQTMEKGRRNRYHRTRQACRLYRAQPEYSRSSDREDSRNQSAQDSITRAYGLRG